MNSWISVLGTGEHEDEYDTTPSQEDPYTNGETHKLGKQPPRFA